jgi:hypothetical protein
MDHAIEEMIAGLSSAPETGAAPMMWLIAVWMFFLSSAPETGAAPIDVDVNSCPV